GVQSVLYFLVLAFGNLPVSCNTWMNCKAF
ncbi:MAG: hypothetical protein ACI9KK_003043, partial [Ascidiaceihabitans sp.]